MEKYKIRNGKTFHVTENNKEKFLLDYPNAVQVDYVPETAPQTNAPTDTTTFEVNSKKYDVTENNREKFFSDFEGENIIEHDRGGGEEVHNIQHLSVEEIENTIGDSWWSKEENAAGYLTNHYQGKQGLDVKFIEAKAGYNTLKMIVDGVELEGYDIDLTGNTSWADLQRNIELKIEDNFGAQDKKERRDEVLLEGILSATSSDDILDYTGGGGDEAEFYNTLDKFFNPDKEIEEYEEKTLDWVAGVKVRDTEKYGNRLSTENRQNDVVPVMALKQAVGEVFSLGNYDQYVVDANGGVTINVDGEDTYVPYTYIWDKRKELLKLREGKLDKEFVEKDGVLVEAFKYTEGSDIGLLNERMVGRYGSEDDFKKHRRDNSFIYLNDPEEVEIRDLYAQLGGVEDEAGREVIKANINKLWKELYPDLSDSDIKDLALLNEDGEFIGIKKPKEFLEGEELSIETNAEGLAREYINDGAFIDKQEEQAYLRLILLAKRAHKNREKISGETNSIVKAVGGAFDFSNDAIDKDFIQLKAVSDNEDIFIGNEVSLGGEEGERRTYANATLSELPGNSDLAKEYNEALRDFKTWSRAVDLNLNINQTSEENLLKEWVNNLSESFVEAKLFDEKDSDEARDAWVGILEHDGYEVPEHVIESSFFRNGSLGKNSFTRTSIEGAGEFLAGLAPLLLELAVFKKVGGLKKIQNVVGVGKTGGLGAPINYGLIGRFANNIKNPAAKWVTKNMVAPGVVAAAEWSIAESAGELVTGGAWKAHTIDWEKGETNLTMPIAMGMSGGAFGIFSQHAVKVFGKTKFGNAILPKLQNPDAWLNATKGGARLKTLGVIPAAAGQGATATVMLTVAETAQAIVDEAIKQEDFAFLERWKEITDTEHLISTWFAMTVLSGKDVAPKAREAFRSTVAGLKRKSERTAEIHERLGTHENSSWGEINSAAKKKIDEIHDSGLSIKETNAKVKEVKQMNKDLKLDKLIENSKKAAIADGRYYEDFVLPRWQIMKNLSTKPINQWKAADYKQIKELKHNELYQALIRSGVKLNSKEFRQYENIYEIIKHKNNIIDVYEIDAGLPEFREEYIQKELSVEINENRIKELKERIKKEEDVGASKRELKKLQEANKVFQESLDTLMSRADISFATKLKAEVAAAEVLARSLGATIKTYTAKEWKEKGFEEAEGSYNEKTSEIHINLDVIKGVKNLRGDIITRGTRNLGTPIHEVIHHILRNSLKGKDGKISQKGIEVINGLMLKFSRKEKAIIQKRIDDNYRYDEVTGKEKDKSDYYEEYVTGISDAIKNKQIKYNQSKFRKIGKRVYPILKPLMPNLYNYKLSKTSSAEATKDLFNMLGDVHTSASSKRVQKGLVKLAKTNPRFAAETAAKVGGMELKKSKQVKIQGLGNEYRVLNKGGKELFQKSIEEGAFDKPRVKEYMKENNLSQEAYFKETADKKNFDAKKSKELWDQGGADKVLGKIYEDLEGLIGSKADQYKGTPDFLREDFISNTMVEIMIHARNFKPGENNNLSGWINSQLRNKALESIKPKTGIIKGKFEISRDIEGGIKDVESTDMTAEEIYDANLVAEAKIKSAVNLRKSLINEKGEPYITDNITEAVENAVLKTLGSKLPNISTRDFQLELAKAYDGFLRDPIVEMMGKGKTYDTFLEIASPQVFKYMPKETLVQMERLVHSKKMLAKYPNAEKIFATKRRITKSVEVDSLVERGLLPKDVSRTSGPNLITKGEFPGIRKIMAFYRGKYKDPITGVEESMLDILGYEVSEAQLNNRKSKLAGSIGSEITFDMTMQTAKLPEVMEKRRLIENKTSEQAQIEIAEMAKRINRDPDMKYSRNKAKVSEKAPTQKELKQIEKWEKLEEGATDHTQMLWLMNEVRLRGRDGVFDTSGKLLNIYKDTKVRQGAVDVVLDLDNRGRIYPEPLKSEIAAQEVYLQQLHKTIRSGVFETIPIQYGLQLGKPFGLEMLTTKVTEGGFPDFHALIHEALAFNVEIKMFDSQLPRNAIGASLNFMTGKHSFKGGDSYDAQMQSMLAEGAPARKKWADFVLKEMQALGINITEITNKTQVPAEVFEKAGRKGEKLQAATTVIKDFKNGLDYVRDKYLAKVLKDGTEVSNHYIDIQSISGKELGLYTISDFNPLNLNIPKLDAKIDMRLRFSASATSPAKSPKGYEKFHKAGQKYYSPSMSFIPVMDMRTITKSSPYSISVKSKFMKLLKSPEFAKLKELNPKEVTENITKQVQSVLGKRYSKSSKKEVIEDARTIDKAMSLGRLVNKKKRGMSTFDFDETVGVSNNFVIATKDGKTKRIASDKWPFVGDKLAKEGWKMDFTDFNKVTDGKPGPLMQKMKNQIEKFGPENVFILTARAKESQGAIYEYLKSEGIRIPKENITGLGNSTGEAKALWMLKKFSEGYNDMYFVDDALPNVKAVKDVLDQLDIKSDVQMVKFSKNKDLHKNFNKILEEVSGIKAEASFGSAKGIMVGRDKGKFKFGTPGMEDFSGLVTYAFAGRGKAGEAHKQFFHDNLQKPFNRAYSEVNTRKQNISEDYKALRKAMPEVRKQLGDNVGGVYNVAQAIRVYNFNKAGYKVPGLSKADLSRLIKHVEARPELTLYADQLSKITLLKEGYIKPTDYWLGENIAMDMNNVVDRVFRKEALGEFVENRKAIFGEWVGGKLVGENMNKIEAIKGPRHREALENMLWRMENGTNRTVGADSATNKWMNWVNSATGTIMFFNQKSAALQTISSLNYVNGTFNNPLRAAQAFANQPQYWKDFTMIFNSDMLLQRRSGLKINIEAAELLERVGGKEGGYARFRAYVLEKGFIPTKYADSFAIASGGATFYRNSIRKYKKQGLSEKEAEKLAFEDFAQMTEATQQSSRPDLISMQQASGLGRPILAFANTPLQMFRRHKRRLQDIVNNRGNMAENIASAAYYGFAQTMIFSYLANAMFATDNESDDQEDIDFAKTRESRHVNTIMDSYLRGMGLNGAAVAALKNGILSARNETQQANADYGNTVIELLNISPPIGSKVRKLYSAGKTYKFNKDVISEMGLRLDNPAVLATTKIISALTNLPADRVTQKLLNLKDASNSEFEFWQRLSMFRGQSKWSMRAKDEVLDAEMEAIEERVRKTRKIEKKKEKEKTNPKATTTRKRKRTRTRTRSRTR